MEKYRFWGAAEAEKVTADTGYPGIATPADLYGALRDCWCAETCAPRMRKDWSEEDRTLGQCSVTSFLAQDLFGGEVFGIPLDDGSFHCFNVVNGHAFDLTSEQFKGIALEYSGAVPQERRTHFSKEEKKQRYLLLKKRFHAMCFGGEEQ